MASLVRLLPWLLDPRVPWAAVGVFARGLASVGLEAACLLSLPIGHALAAAAFSDRGETLACLLIGASPSSLLARLWPLWLSVALLGGGASLAWGREHASPGRALSALIEAARAGCDAQSRPVSDVPGTGASWICFHGESPRLVALSGGAVVQAESASLSDDLARIEVRALRVALRGSPSLRIEAHHASIRGAAPFARASQVPPWTRALAGMTASILGAYGCALVLLSARDTCRVVALILGVGAGLVPLWLLGLLDRHDAGLLLHLTLPGAAMLPTAAYVTLSAIARRTRRSTPAP